MTSPRWSSVLFDMDGTLANTIPLILASYRHTMEVAGLEPADDTTIRSWIGRTLDDMWVTLAGAERAPELMEAYTDWQLAHVDEYLQPFEGIKETVADMAAAGVRMGVATSRRRESAELIVRTLGLGDLPVLVAMEDTAVHKPNPEPLLLAAERLGVRPVETAYVGDALVDLRAADAAGMDGIGVTWGAGVAKAMRAEPSVAVVDTVDDLRELLIGATRASTR